MSRLGIIYRNNYGNERAGKILPHSPSRIGYGNPGKMLCLTLNQPQEPREEGSPKGFAGPVEADEAYFGGLEKNKQASMKSNAGRVTASKTAVVDLKDRSTKQVSARRGLPAP